MRSSSSTPEGFTLIELMITVAILGILALIAVPKFTGLIIKSKEAGTLGHLGHTRSGILLYYMDNDQFYPPTFSDFIQPGKKYIKGVSPLYTGDHADSFTVDDLTAVLPNSDASNWGYVSSGLDAGTFYIQCTHPDEKGRMWSQY